MSLEAETGGGCRPSFARIPIKPVVTLATLVTVIFLISYLPSSDAAEEPIAISAGAWIPDEPYEEGQPLEPGIPIYQMLGYYTEEDYDLQWNGYDTVLSGDPYMNDDDWWVYCIKDHAINEWIVDYLQVLSSVSEELACTNFIIENVNPEIRTITIAFENGWDELYAQGKGFTFVPTRLMDGDEVFWTIAEVADIYESESNLKEIPTPAKEGYRFTGWYEDPECTVPWEFMTLGDWLNLSGNIVETFPYLNRFIYAGWEELESPFTATSGSGTEDDPYSGTLEIKDETFVLENASYLPAEIWVESGTVFDVRLDEVPTPNTYALDEGFGLEVTLKPSTGCKIIGTATGHGDCNLVITSLSGEDDRITFHIVSDYPALEVLSDPTDPLFATITSSKP